MGRKGLEKPEPSALRGKTRFVTMIDEICFVNTDRSKALDSLKRLLGPIRSLTNASRRP